MSALVSTVMMATLVVGPFYLSRRARARHRCGRHRLVGWSAGGRADRRAGGPHHGPFWRTTHDVAGLIGMAAGSFALAMLPATLGIPGYVAPLVVITVGYALFQTANNTAVMTDIRPDRRGVISGMLNLSRNLGLITGASVMGAVFALASASARHRDGASRGGRHRHAGHVRRRGAADRRSARHRGVSSRSPGLRPRAAGAARAGARARSRKCRTPRRWRRR